MIQFPNGDWVNPSAVTRINEQHGDSVYISVMNSRDITLRPKGDDTTATLRDKMAAMVNAALGEHPQRGGKST